MEKFLLILRGDVTRLTALTPDEWLADIPVMLEWIQFLNESGNYCSGAPVDFTGRCVAKEKVIEDYSVSSSFP